MLRYFFGDNIEEKVEKTFFKTFLSSYALKLRTSDKDG